MAAKCKPQQHGHGQDSGVIERRLRPIYEWLEVGNNKKALQESEKVVKKWPGVTCGRALRCLACLRLGREAEACSQLETLVAETPTDDATLQVIAMCYRELQQLEKVCTLYEQAVKADFSNEELHTHLFMSYVRVGALDKQHHAAMQLYKLKPKNPYYFWAVMSVLLQATRGSGSNDPARKAVLVALCGRMVERLAGGSISGVIGAGWEEQELKLYLRVLSLQGRHKEALTLLASPHCRATLMPGEAEQASLPLLAQTQNWVMLNTRVKTLIWDNPDRWDLYLHYLDSTFHLMEMGDKPVGQEGSDSMTPLETDDTPLKCRDFLVKVMAKGGPLVRGPYLARLELFKRMRERNMNPEGVLGSSRDLLVSYLAQFGSKACSVSDLGMFLCLQPPQERSALAQAFKDTAKVTEQDDIPSLPEDAMQRHISALQLCRMCGSPPSVEELLRALRPPRAPAPAIAQRAPTDPYCLLLAHHLLHTALTKHSSQPLLRALDVLHDTIERSPSNFHCKLLAIKIYHLLGCGWGAQQLYSKLEVKHMQLDSMGYVHCSLVGATGAVVRANDHYSQALRFFSQSYKDSLDHLTLSYKFGSFKELEELMNWRERLHSSLHHALCAIEKHTVDLYAVTNSVPTYTPPDWEAARDNRHVGLLVSWEPPTEGETDKDFQRELWYCKLKGSILKCVGTHSEVSQQDIETLQVMTEQASICKEDQEQPCMSRLNTLLPVVPVYACALTSLLKVRETPRDGEKEMEECCKRLIERQDRVVKAIEEHSKHEDSLWTYRNTMDTVVTHIELVSMVCVVGGLCADARNNKGKTKWRPPSTLTTALQTLLTAVTGWPAPAPSLTHQLDTLSLASGDFPRNPTWDLMSEHHAEAVATFRVIIKDKIKYVTGLSAHH